MTSRVVDILLSMVSYIGLVLLLFLCIFAIAMI